MCKCMHSPMGVCECVYVWRGGGLGLTCQYGFVAAMATWGILTGAAFPTQDAVILGAEGLLGQGFVALGAAEASLVPVPVLVVQLLMRKQKGEDRMSEYSAVHANRIIESDYRADG